MDERTVIGQEQQAFAVPVQPSAGIHSRHIDKVLEAGFSAFGGELAEYAVGFVEEQVPEAASGPRDHRRLAIISPISPRSSLTGLCRLRASAAMRSTSDSRIP